MAQAKWVHSPPIKDFMASFDLAGSSHKPTNTSHSSQAHIASTHTKTNRHIKLPRNFFVILITSDKQSTNSHVFRPTLRHLRRTQPRTIQNFYLKAHTPKHSVSSLYQAIQRNCKRNFDSCDFALSHYQISPQTMPTLAYPTDNLIKSYLKASTSNIPRYKTIPKLKK